MFSHGGVQFQKYRLSIQQLFDLLGVKGKDGLVGDRGYPGNKGDSGKVGSAGDPGFPGSPGTMLLENFSLKKLGFTSSHTLY